MCLVKNNRIHFLTDTHKPSMESERARIEQAGGFVTCASGTWRVNDTLAVSRSFGDCSFQASGLTCEPDVRTIELDGSEDYFILGCDGLFEHIAVDSSLSEFIEQALGGAGGGKEGRGEESDTDDRTNGETRDNNTPNIAELLVGRAKDNGSTDNISVIFVRLK
jgi:serine/threonine protein phosphatase PrpC